MPTPPASWKTPEASIILACTPRSGSTYLAQLLDSTGLFRLTEEYFNDRHIERMTGIATTSVEQKLAIIDQHSRTRRNQISLKLFPPNMMTVLEHGLLKKAFLNPMFIYMRRGDVLGQAMSLARAVKTDQWNSVDYGRPVSSEYDRRDIEHQLGILLAQDTWWQYFFATRDVPVLRLTYEDVEEDPVAVAAQIVRFLGFDPAEFPADPSKVRLQKQRDELTDEWRSRFLAEEHAIPQPWDGRPKARTLRNAIRFLRGTL